MQNLCFILEFHSRIFWLSCIWISAVVLWVFLDLSSSSVGHQRKLLALCDYMHIDALFTNKAQMNKVLVQWLLVNMWALLHFWNVSRLPLQVLSRMSSKFYCRSGSSFNFIETWKTTWTRMGRRRRVRHGQHAVGLDIRWQSSRVGDYVLACAWVRRGDW